MLIHSQASSPATAGQVATGQAERWRSRTFQFGPFLLQPERQRLLKLDAPVRIGGRALDLLTILVERAGEIVSKKDLMSWTWPDTFVEEGNLKVNIALLRRALGECHASPRFIATVVGRGYRFIAPVEPVGPDRDRWMLPGAGDQPSLLDQLASVPAERGQCCGGERSLSVR